VRAPAGTNTTASRRTCPRAASGPGWPGWRRPEAAASGSPELRRIVESWKPQIEAGRTPAEVLSAGRKFPETFANLYATGEVSGQLDDSLKRLYQYYNEEGTRKLYAFAQWTPRLVYFAVVLIIAYKIVRFYTGYFNEVNAMSHF